jgi:hypothetical protein
MVATIDDLPTIPAVATQVLQLLKLPVPEKSRKN